jgi:DNA transformation protein
VPLDADLLALLLDAAEGLPLVESRRMFAGHGLWASGRMFALVYDGRIAFKLTEEPLAREFRALPGSQPFRVGRKSTKFTGWLVAPEAFHDDPEELRRWTAVAHELALRAPSIDVASRRPPARRRKRK